MSRPLTAELSLRHLPDISDTSFQISFADDSVDQLLATDDDFLHGANDSIGPGNSGQDYLTLSQLTPKPRPRTALVTAATPVSTMPRPPGHETRPVPDSKANERTMFIRPKAVKRTPLASRKIESETATANRTRPLVIDAPALGRLHPSKTNEEILHGASPSHRSDPADDDSILTIGDYEALPGTALSHAVRSLRSKKAFKSPILTAGGGITKTLGKSKLPNSALSRTLANKPQSRPQQKERIAFDVQADLDLAESTHCDAGLPASGNVSICSTAPGPVAERLLRYGHNLESTFGLSNSAEQRSGDRCEELPTVSHDVGSENTSSSNNRPHSTEPLTLADLSPQRRMNVGPARDIEPEKPPKSPVGALRKRTCPDASSSPKQPRKKGRFNNTSHDAAALQPSVRENTEPIRSGSGSNVVERTKKPGGGVARMISRTVRTAKGKAKEDDTGLLIPTKHRQPSESKRVTAMQNSASHQAEIELGSGRGPYEVPKTIASRINSQSEFNFRLDARMDVRRPEVEEKENQILTGSKRVHARHPIPDFKALHATQEAKLASLRAKPNPVLPLPLQLSTEDRMRERRKFDEMMKEKEKENQSAIEEKRRQREQEEEREIKEMRKRAVPRAHDVPEWYTTAPRRKAG